ncbi:response regulator [Vagococcus carniphilus]|uniref:Response regulator n=1 Tax=Vagococcus carniphilus TaxID=218144 RepID=A0AAW8U722_9ENTE|nr:response regulator [Vagococcus carniphilus]MDT2834914.1 response regulator [Vagococcus carniphilus]
MNLLIIDDEPIFSKGFKKVIEKNTTLFTSIFIAATAKDVLTLIDEKEKIDVFFVDINLPDMNGLDLIKKIKVIYPESLIVVISGYNDFNYARQAIHLKVFDYLLKPLAPSDVKHLLHKIEEELTLEKKTSKNEKFHLVSPLCVSAINTIEEHYANKDLNLTSVANDLFVDNSYLSKQMKKFTGKSFNDYLTHYRIKKAKELLSQTSIRYTIQEIGERVGYPNQHYFSRLFKQQTQLTPTQYRDQFYH